MLIHVITVRMMQMAVMEVIRVALVRDRRVAARRSMDVRVSVVLVTIRHLVLSGWRLVPLCALRVAGSSPTERTRISRQALYGFLTNWRSTAFGSAPISSLSIFGSTSSIVSR